MRVRASLVVLMMAGAVALALGVLVAAERDGASSPLRVESEDQESTTTDVGASGAESDGLGGNAGDAPPTAAPDEGAGLFAGATAERCWDSELSLREEAERVLNEADERDDCVLAHAGYLDFSGRVWGCVMQGSSWVEICVAWARAEGSGSEVRVWRISADEFAARGGSG